MKKVSQSLIEYSIIIFTVLLLFNSLTRFGKPITKVGNRTNGAISSSSKENMTDYCNRLYKTYDASIGLCK